MNHLGVTQDTNKCALITASSKGLGRAIAREFALNGYDIILNGRNEEIVYETQFYLNHQLLEDVICESVIGDLRSDDTIQELYDVSKGQISVLVNNKSSAFSRLLSHKSKYFWDVTISYPIFINSSKLLLFLI